jgi:hypothetical protein
VFHSFVLCHPDDVGMEGFIDVTTDIGFVFGALVGHKLAANFKKPKQECPSGQSF